MQVAVAVDAPDGPLDLVGAAVAVDVVARVAVLAVGGDVGVELGEDLAVLNVEAVEHVGEGVLGNLDLGLGEVGAGEDLVVRPYGGDAGGGAFAHGRIPVAPGA